jgi:Zn-dependent M28 family amino/carboxypeptidase
MTLPVRIFLALLATTPFSALAAAEVHSPSVISTARLRDHVRVLASDAFEGRGPGEPAEVRTLDYLVGQFKAAGLKPGAPGGGWLQPVPMTRYDRDSKVSVSITSEGGEQRFVVGQDVTLASHAIGHSHVDHAPVVFAGFGIHQADWNDFAGADLTGKVVLLLGNDPDFEAPPGSPVLGRFGGRALVYGGRLGVKVGAAMAAGAAGVLVVHEDGALSWPWRQAQNSDRLPSMALSPDQPALPNSFNGLVRKDVAESLLRRSGYELSQLKAMAREPGFRAFPLKMTVTADFNVGARDVVSHNVVARLPGRLRPSEVVLYGAHWDANGKGAPDALGDAIRNGAVDNATGTAELLEVARRFATMGAQQRTLVFVAYTAEEKGLVGSDFYAAHPFDSLEKTAAVINLDPHVMLGRARNLEIVGPGQTNIEDDLNKAAHQEGLRVDPEPFPEAGWYFRSDHYSFSKRGVPSLSFRIGRDLAVGGLEAGLVRSADYNTNRYHQTKDEFDPNWSFDGAAQEAAVAYRVGAKIANSALWPQWRKGVEYDAIRTQSAPARAAAQR